MNDTQILRSLMESMQKTSQPKTSPYDTTAEVRRIEDGIAWVHIAGGVDETPVRLTINAKEGDSVQVRVSGGTAFLVGNGTAPPTDDTRANIAQNTAKNAQIAADTAIEDAERAKEAADSAQASADSAAASAASAQVSANNANEYASRALGGLSTVQSVVETLTWITQHGTMTLTTDTEIDPTHVYFVQDAQGDYVVGSTHYSIVTEPSADDLSTYYVLSIDESLQNYVGTHLAVTGEGLWVLPAATGYKVLIATGQGTQYTEAGTYIIDASGNTTAKFDSNGVYFYKDGEVCARFGTTALIGREHVAGSLVTKIAANIVSMERWVTDYSAVTMLRAIHDMYNDKNYVVIGTCDNTYPQYGDRSLTVGNHTGQCGATGSFAVAMNSNTEASGQSSFSSGENTVASGWKSVAMNGDTIAQRKSQVAIGEFNEADTAGADGEHRGDYVFIIGNGTSDSARSNALAVDWSGNVKAAGHVSGKTEALTITRVANSYCDTTSIGRLYACRKNGFLYLRGNLELSTNVPTGTSETTVATISGWIAVASDYHTVAGQSGGGALGLHVTYDGDLKIYNTSGSAATGWHRFSVIVPVHPNYD